MGLFGPDSVPPNQLRSTNSTKFTAPTNKYARLLFFIRSSVNPTIIKRHEASVQHPLFLSACSTRVCSNEKATLDAGYTARDARNAAATDPTVSTVFA